MRHVYPYPNTTSYTVNERLHGKTVMEMFTDTKRYQPEKVVSYIYLFYHLSLEIKVYAAIKFLLKRCE